MTWFLKLQFVLSVKDSRCFATAQTYNLAIKSDAV